MIQKYLPSIAALLCGSSIVTGAILSHILSPYISQKSIHLIELGSTYLFWHGLAILIHQCCLHLKWSRWHWISYTFLIGACIFSGTLICYALTNIIEFTHITPIGGFTLILSWFILAFDMILHKET